MKVVAVIPSTNSPGKRDVTGAFRPEALRFLRAWGPGNGLIVFDNTKLRAQRRAHVLEWLRDDPDVDVVAFFCHGLPGSIQAGFDRTNVDELADATDAQRIVLYACSAGGGADPFASHLARAGHTVWAHTTVGHTTMNPHVMKFTPWASGVASGWVTEPGSAGWPSWRKRLRTDPTYRFRFWAPESEWPVDDAGSNP